MTMQRHRPASVIALALLSLASVLLIGCSGLTATAPVRVPGGLFHGGVHGGQQPVVNAEILLYAAGNTGYGSSYPYGTATSLLGGASVRTDIGGNFSVTGLYTCPSASTPVYLVARQGSPGPGSPNNPNIAAMAALGACGNLTSSTYISVNEVTTVASVWALSPFMSGITNVGTSPANALGLTNAFASVNKLVSTDTGTVSGPALPTGAILPVAKINTLADILAACINSAGGVAGDGSLCGKLFDYTTVNGIAPTDTITAALNIAQHPNTQTANLTYLASPSSPFQPTLIAAPSDFSLVVTYSGGGLSQPKAIALDSSGSVWLPNAGNSSVTKLSNSGAALSGVNGFTAGSLGAPSAIAIDSSGNAWVASSSLNTLTVLNPSGIAGLGYNGIGISMPSSIAIDASSNVWVANSTGVTQISSAGVLTTFSTAGIATPTAIVINPK